MKKQKIFNEQEQIALIFELTNSMEYFNDADDFADIGLNHDQRSFLLFLFEQYWDLDAVIRLNNTDDDWKRFINECLDKHQTSQ